MSVEYFSVGAKSVQAVYEVLTQLENNILLFLDKGEEISVGLSPTFLNYIERNYPGSLHYHDEAKEIFFGYLPIVLMHDSVSFNEMFFYSSVGDCAIYRFMFEGWEKYPPSFIEECVELGILT